MNKFYLTLFAVLLPLALWADAKIKGDAVIVSSMEVSTPVAVRYAWPMNPSQRNLLYNKDGLPASPFRTDSWPLFDPKKDQAVTVNKPQKPEGYQPKDWARPKMIQLQRFNDEKPIKKIQL